MCACYSVMSIAVLEREREREIKRVILSILLLEENTNLHLFCAWWTKDVVFAVFPKVQKVKITVDF